ncbi:MAG: hypothetical protein QGH70_01040 [Nitrospinota bacterium]|nr:hypothetical protein [Nitrospinota bacterium]MDP6482415.1 hypothetical protein [Nitrospinota bacterium]
MLDLALGLEVVEQAETVLGVEVVHRGVVKEVEIEGVHAEALEASLDAPADVFRREVVDPRRHVVPALGADDDPVPVGALLEELADHFLAVPLTVGVGGVDEIDPRVDRRVEGLVAHGVVHGSEHSADGHRAKADDGHFQSGLSERALFHPSRSPGLQGRAAGMKAVLRPLSLL